MTGDPTRKGVFGYNKNSSTEDKFREFSFSQFTFPACDACNTNFSKLEANSKPILRKILDEVLVTGNEVSIFLDWLDKIRIGLWLSMIYLDKNYLDIKPKFHIGTRLGQSDRVLIIEKSDSAKLKLNFGGVDAPAFSITPSAFILIVNNYYFTNISSPFLFSRRLGLPYPNESHICPEEDRIDVSISPGTQRIMTPLLRKVIKEKGVRLFQPMFKNDLMSDGIKQYYVSEYVSQHAMDLAHGRGNIFDERERTVREYKDSDPLLLRPDIVQDDYDIFVRSAIHISEWQNWLTSLLPSNEKLSQQQKLYMKSRFRMAREVNNKFIIHHTQILENYLKTKN